MNDEYAEYVEWANSKGAPVLSKEDWLIQRVSELQQALDELVKRVNQAEENIRFLNGWNGEG